ncbi:MAG: penicillin-binding protein 2 [Gammaproteobacteria bacterium]|nr:penicillin-binding protein 2 [Gammaproteobacteria bacterium]
MASTLFVSNIRLKDHWSEQRLFVRRTIMASVLVTALMIFVVVRLTELQVLNYQHFTDLSQGNRIRIEPVPPTRGLIYDRNGILLAENLPAYQLEMTPEQVPDIEGTLARLEALGFIREQDEERIRSTLASQSLFKGVPLRFRLTEEEVARFAVRRPLFPGVDIRASLTRHYPYGPTAVHAIGYVGSISKEDQARLDPAAYAGTSHVGKIGLERTYEDALHGAAGVRQVLVNVQGRALSTLSGDAPRPGRNLILSLDLDMQLAAEAALEGRRGAIVAIDPRNGEVRVFASMPGYDPNAFGEGLSVQEFQDLQSDPDQPLFDRAMRGHYPPGSTIKPVIALAGLSYEVVDPERTIFCGGFYRLPDHTHRYRDWKREGHGRMNLHDAIVQSCDVYFYELALALDIDRMHDFAVQFGAGSPTGIDIMGEKPGVMPSRDWKRRAFSRREDQVWFPGETLITGIGQGFTLMTPLQVAHVTATLAARGQRFEPSLVSAIEDPLSGERIERQPRELEPVRGVDPAQWERVLGAMRDVVHGPRGTARAIASSEYEIAGKTGTAQVFTVPQEESYDAEEVEERLRDHALFIAFAPFEQPEIAIAVLVENGGSGSKTAAPVARQVLDSYFGSE